MIHLKFLDQELRPAYMTQSSAGADLKAAETTIIQPHSTSCVRTGVWIDCVDWHLVPEGCIPELQVRARSGLALKKGICLANGVGTIDADYPEEIGVLLWNTRSESFAIEKGDRIAQLVLTLAHRIPGLQSEGLRGGGFGSTGQKN